MFQIRETRTKLLRRKCFRRKLGKLGLELAGSLERFWLIRGQNGDEERWIEEALSKGGSVTMPVRARASASLGALKQRQNKFAEARALYEESLKLFDQAGQNEETAWMLLNLGRNASDCGDIPLACDYWERALASFRRLNLERGVAFVLNDMAYRAAKRGAQDQARTYREECVALFRQLGEQEGLAWALYNLGQVMSDLQDYKSSKQYTKEALGLFRALKYEDGIAWSHYSLAILMLNLVDLTQAFLDIQKSLALFRKLGNDNGVAWSLHILGRIAFEQGDLEFSERCYQENLTIHWQQGNRPALAYAFEGFARLASRDHPERASFLFGAAEALREATDSPLPLADRSNYERDVGEACRRLAPSSFRVAWDAGRAATLEELYLFILSHFVQN